MNSTDVWLKYYKLSRGYLMHSGVKGQKWGVRNGPPYPLKKQQKSGSLKMNLQFFGKKKWSDYEIIDPQSGKRLHLVEGTQMRNPTVFAGKGGVKPLREEVAEGLAEELGGKPENWQHCKGFGVIDDEGEEREAEVHWFQEESAGKHRFKVKEWKDE